jgi:predicted Zn-ribbon and HTH transcriptional regulator
MKTAVVTLLHKKGDRDQIGNYRPISLLCDDYKIFTKALAERMKTVLSSIIQTSQQGFTPNGDIRGSIIQVKEIIEFCERNEEDAAIIFMDFQKAFDKVDHNCIKEVLEKFNFGSTFTNTVMALYNNVKSKIIVNGQLSEDVHIKGGVRQGCPLSPYLFICVLELLARRIQTDKSFRGIADPNSRVDSKISLFADDAAGFVSDVRQAISKFRQALSDYEKATGAKLHDGKTMVLMLGRNKHSEIDLLQHGVQFKRMETDQKERYLGGLVGNNITESDKFKEPLEKLKKVKKEWSRVNTDLLGRVTVANAALLPVVKYRGNFNTTSKELTDDFQQQISSFIWKEKRAKRKWQFIVQPYKNGGLNVTDPETALKAEKLGILQRAERNKNHPWVAWKEAKDQEIRRRWHIVGDITRIKTNKKLTWNKEDLFEETYSIWHSISTSKEADTQDKNSTKAYLYQGVWWNPNITDSKGESFYEENLAKAGVTTVYDFIFHYHHFLLPTGKTTQTTQNLAEKVKNFALQEEKKIEKRGEIENETQEETKTKKDQPHGLIDDKGRWINFDDFRSRNAYYLLLAQKYKIEHPTNAALTELRSNLKSKEITYWWEHVHNTIPTKAQLCHFDRNTQRLKINDSRCPMCETEKETRIHLNSDCAAAKVFWEHARQHYNEIGTFSAEKWNLQGEASELSRKAQVTIAKMRFIWNKHRYDIMRKRRKQADVDLVINELRLDLENYEKKYSKTTLQADLDRLISEEQVPS